MKCFSFIAACLLSAVSCTDYVLDYKRNIQIGYKPIHSIKNACMLSL